MKTKSLIMLVCALLIVSSVAFGTIAYLTDRAVVTNKFTIGNVDITVDETQVDKDGNPVPDPDYDPENSNPEDPIPNLRTEGGNEYPLIPGSEYPKDPTMTVQAGSEPAYVRLMVTLTNAKEIDTIFADLKAGYGEKYANGFVPGDFVTGRDNTQWVYTGEMVKDEALNTYTLEFRYFEAVAPTDTEDLILPALFATIKLPGEMTNAHLATLTDFEVRVEGHAIQITGFENADEAWAAFDAQLAATAATENGNAESGEENNADSGNQND